MSKQRPLAARQPTRRTKATKRAPRATAPTRRNTPNAAPRRTTPATTPALPTRRTNSAKPTRRTTPTPPAADRPRTSHFARFGAEYPAVAAAYEALSAATQHAGPLDPKTRALVKLALAVGAFREGTVHSATGRARTAGCTPAEIRHAVVLATTTLGFPSTMAALRWVDDVLRPKRR
jgi:alkylhydroperoxidase/carboxymuconolactone decarboxylase family protein YurZ